MPSNITPLQLKEKLDRGDKIAILDIRERDEVEYVRLENSVWIPLRELPARVRELDPETETVVLCHLGIRSVQAQLFLQAKGFRNIVNLSGGIDAWAVEADPTMRRYR